jgi:hypothetical protein
MLRYLLSSTAALILLPNLPLAAGERKAEGTPLLISQAPDGRLAGWKAFHERQASIGDVWTLREGVLTCKGLPLGYLYTEKAYTDFRLTLEWRSPTEKKPGKGGVLFRKSGKDQIWPRSLEAQLNTGDEGDFWGLDGYALSGPADRLKRVQHARFGQLIGLRRTRDAVRKPGEWNLYEISAREGTVTLKINGEVVNRATQCAVVAGPICLTAEGDEIHFRNVRIILE